MTPLATRLNGYATHWVLNLSLLTLCITVVLSTTIQMQQGQSNNVEYFSEKAKHSFGQRGILSPQHKHIIRKCSENPKKLGAFHYVDRTHFLINEPRLCDGSVFILLAIHTNAPYKDRRSAIRRTWGSIRQVGNKRVKLVFFLGNSGFQGLQKEIEEESRAHRDIIQRDYVEHYRNMTRKHLTILEWMTTYCSHAEYLLKADDDTFVDIFHAVRFVQFNNVPGFYCTATARARPHRRNKSNKWMVTYSEYASSRYPTYCEGFGYILRGSLVRDLYWCSVYSKFFWIDDVYVAGILPEKLGIPRQRFWTGHSYAYMLPSHASHRLLDFIFLMASHNEFMPAVWNKLWRAAVEHSMDESLML